MDKVEEGTTAYLTVTFKNKSGIPEAPASATWECIDLKSETVMQVATDLTPAGTIEITIPRTVNRIINQTLAWEIRRITVKALYNADDGVNGQYDYQVDNLSGVTNPPP